jgi:fimbrial chaperone protein
MLRQVSAAIVSALALGLTAGPAAAQAITVMPVVVDMQPGQLAATLSISGQGGSETSYQVRAFAWRQDGNSDRLDPTDDVVLSPPLGVIPPNATQIVRIVVRRAPKDRESVYRILLDQIPPPSAPGTVRIALRLSLPVFVEPATRVAPQLDWRIERDANSVYLVAMNNGTRHERVRDIELSAGGETFKPEGDNSPYLLPGTTRRFRLSGNGTFPAAGAGIRLTAQSDGGKIDVLVHDAQRL